MTQEELLSRFEKLPSKDDLNYTVKLKEIVQKEDLIAYETDLFKIIESDKECDIRFAAFYALLIAYREYSFLSRYNELVDKYGEGFSEIKLYNIVLSTYYRNQVILGDKNGGEVSILHAKLSCNDFQDSYAVKHHYSETVAYMAESGIDVNTKDIEDALRLIDEVILQVPKHSTYYCTKGRLLSIRGDFSKAEYCLNRAIDLEEANTKDAIIRVGKFNHYLSLLQLQKNKVAMEAQYNAFKSRIEKDENEISSLIDIINGLQTKYLEYLGFFSAVLAIIMISINVVVKVTDYNKAVGLIAILAGVLIVSFTTFCVLLPDLKGEDNKKNSILCGIVAVVLIMFGTIFGGIK